MAPYDIQRNFRASKGHYECMEVGMIRKAVSLDEYSRGYNAMSMKVVGCIKLSVGS